MMHTCKNRDHGQVIWHAIVVFGEYNYIIMCVAFPVKFIERQVQYFYKEVLPSPREIF